MTVARPIENEPASRISRPTLLAAALAYTTFAVYGSFVPLNFVPISLPQAWMRFEQIQWLDLGVGQRADWVANVLLFVPLAFFWLGSMWPRHFPARVAASAVVWSVAVALAVSIEFTQAYFPGRTMSVNDIVAEWLGAALGVAAWWAVGPAVLAWIAQLRAVARPMTAIERILTAYLIAVVAYALLPLDLTMSATEIFRKWKQGRVVLMPFAFHEGNAAESVYSLLNELLLWTPIGIFAARRWPSTLGVAALRVTCGAAALEVLQLFVFSRTTDINDVLAAGMGGLAGAWIGQRAGMSGAARLGRRHGGGD